MMWVAGVRALYLQALHPRAVRGVTQNSDFRQDPFGRLLRTADYVGGITYADAGRAERSAARIRGVHRRLSAVDPDTGERYPVDEPELLLWIHCAEIDSYLTVCRRAGYPLNRWAADRYVDEQRVAARLVGLDPDAVPADTAGLARYLRRMLPRLAAVPETFEVRDFLLAPPVPRMWWPARVTLWRQASYLAYSALPGWAHQLYRTRPLPEALTTLGLRALRRTLLTIPAALRWRIPPGHIPAALDRLGASARPRPGGWAVGAPPA
jgi:uncharacterized protein (DUF2236 family)